MANETNENVTLENMIETEVELANPPTDGSSVSVLADPDPEDTIEAYISTYEIGRGWDMEDKLEYALRDIEDAVATLQTGKADATHTHDGYASSTHTHDGYVSSSDLETLSDIVDTKANATHTHSEYSLTNHTHDGYATQTALDTLSDEVDGKADSTHSHSEYALTSHEHDYAPSNHNHDSDYAPLSHSHSGYVTTTDFDALETVVNGKANESHTHSDYATVTSLNEVSTVVSGKANASHSHNDTYYTETEIDTKLSGKSDISHTHTGVYDASGSATSALASAKEYTDSKIDALVGEGASTTLDTIGEISSAIEDNQDAIDLLNSAIANKANASDLTSHANDTDIHITEAERNNWNAKANSSHTHTIANITNLQTTLDGKASTSHSHNAATTSTAGLMSATDKTKLDGIASGANAYTLPTASSTLGGVKTTSTVTSASGYTACPIIGGVPYYKDTNTTYSLSSFGVTATATELNYVDGVTSNVQTQLNGKASSSHNHSDIYADASHTHTASSVGAIATDDVATVSEVGIYLGI